MSAATRRERALEDALRWIRYTALQHYMGQAFDPEHMLSIAEFAGNALAGEPIPDFAEAVLRAQENAKVLAAQLKEISE